MAVAHHVLAENPDSPRCRHQQAEKDLEGGRFSGPVTAEKRRRRGGADGEIDAGHRIDRPELLVQAFDGDDGILIGHGAIRCRG